MNNDMNICNLREHIALDRVEWRRKIHIVDPNDWDTRLDLVHTSDKHPRRSDTGVDTI